MESNQQNEPPRSNSQLCFQALYAYAISDVSQGIILAFSASLLSMTASTLSYWIGRDVSDTKPVVYYLSTQCYKRMDIAFDDMSIDENNLMTYSSKGQKLITPNLNAKEMQLGGLTEQEHSNLLLNRGKTWALGKEIAEVFGIPQKNIEIGYSMMNKYGLVTHIIHYVYESDLTIIEQQIKSVSAKLFVEKLYQTFENEINNVIRTHFKISNDFETKVCSALSLADSKAKKLMKLLATNSDSNIVNDNNNENEPHFEKRHSQIHVLQKLAQGIELATINENRNNNENDSDAKSEEEIIIVIHIHQ
ncbi:MAG: hypothetical protein GY755_17845 [Chloroflexi bacterium]|nr:hypothetical protein [Chloroflexota bacterium]